MMVIVFIKESPRESNLLLCGISQGVTQGRNMFLCGIYQVVYQPTRKYSDPKIEIDWGWQYFSSDIRERPGKVLDYSYDKYELF